MRTLLDLVVPPECGGCRRPGTPWCAECARSLSGPPIRVYPRADPGVPCWALSRYRGPARQAVLAAKERNRRDLAEPLGLALAAGLAELRAPDRPLILVPSPSRWAAARRRGGDPVLRCARIAARSLSGCQVLPCLRVWWGVRDSAGLSARERDRNLRGRVRAAPLPSAAANAQVVLVDDVLTTGATVSACTRALVAAGTRADGVFVTCAG
ncbi:ComF family protein [Nocardia zapadnayensis]|uniref:ComF family protein n=1 Tax=Nocardia rhamnosiphila TaxID=426716 RepID=UPI0022484C74|nr:ComF family protein [Nocardia zapadnayensis]MCX0271420.1 ComF family protein [Nocardia zapadnayensis]